MNILLWVLQILLALHTVMGAVWKLSNSEQMVDSLKAVPHGVWQLLIVIELLCAVALIIPVFAKKFGKLVPIAALVIAGEMALFCIVHLTSGEADNHPMIYWLVVAAICIFIAFGRSKLNPL